MNRHVRELEEKTYDNLVDLGVSKIYDTPVTGMDRRDIENIELMNEVQKVFEKTK